MSNPEAVMQNHPAFIENAMDKLRNTSVGNYIAIGALSVAGAIGINTIQGAINPESTYANVNCSVTVGGATINVCPEEAPSEPDPAAPEAEQPPAEVESEAKPPKNQNGKNKTDKGDSIEQPKTPKPKRDKWPIGFVNYDQGDWAYPDTGCGPTAYSMVAATLKGNRRITPGAITSKFSPEWYNPGVTGTDPKAFFAIGARQGLKVEDYEGASRFQQAKEALEEGGLAIIHAKQGSGYFTENGHYLVLKRVKDDKFRIADPNGKGLQGDSESRWWSVKALKKRGIGDIWTFKRKK